MHLSLIYIFFLFSPAVFQGSHSTQNTGQCGPGQALRGDGICANARVNQRVFLFEMPAPPPAAHAPPPRLPEPVVEATHLLINTPEGVGAPDPIVIPPPKQKNVLYFLNKQIKQDRKVIEVPSPPSFTHDVFFVDYSDGENPILPDGFDLKAALRMASLRDAPVIGDSGTDDANTEFSSDFDLGFPTPGDLPDEGTFFDFAPGSFGLDFEDTDFKIPNISSISDLESISTQAAQAPSPIPTFPPASIDYTDDGPYNPY